MTGDAAGGARRARGRLLLVSEYYPPRIFGGGELSAELLAKGLGERGFEVWVLTSRLAGLPEREERGGVQILRRLRTGRSPLSVAANIRRVLSLPRSIHREAGRLVAEGGFDAVLLLNSTSVVPLALGVPTVAVVNGYTPFCPKGNLYFEEREECLGCGPRRFVRCITRSRYVGRSPMGWYLRFNPLFWAALYQQYRGRRRALAGVDRFVAISGFVEEVLHRHGVARERVERVYNLADMSGQTMETEPSGELSALLSGRRVVVLVGSLERIKGFETAIRAFSSWHSGSDLLLIAGEGSERGRLEKLCRALGIEGSVHFAGQVDGAALAAVYRAAHAVVVPSLWPEPFSRVVMEAAFHGCPLLASSRGGNRDLPREHLFSSAEELAARFDDPPVPPFDPYDRERNLDRFVALLGRTVPEL